MLATVLSNQLGRPVQNIDRFHWRVRFHVAVDAGYGCHGSARNLADDRAFDSWASAIREQLGFQYGVSQD